MSKSSPTLIFNGDVRLSHPGAIHDVGPLPTQESLDVLDGHAQQARTRVPALATCNPSIVRSPVEAPSIGSPLDGWPFLFALLQSYGQPTSGGPTGKDPKYEWLAETADPLKK